MSTAKVAIIIPNWNTQGLLRDCLSSIFNSFASNSHDNSFEIIVIDNASSDGSSEMLKTEFPQVKLIQNQQNLGFAKAVNLGLRAVLGSFDQGQTLVKEEPYLFLLNSDTVIEKNAIGSLVSFLERNPRAGIVGPRLKNTDGSWQSSARNFPNAFTHFVEMLGLPKRISRLPLADLLFRSYYMLWDYQNPKKVDWLMGAALMVRARAVLDVGLMDEHYFMYGEEMDWQYQFKKKGWEVWYYPKAEIVHLGGKSTEKVKEKSLKWQFENFKYFTQKNYSRWQHYLLRLVTQLGLRLMVWRMKDLEQREIYCRVLS